jgi:hypothetical protein
VAGIFRVTTVSWSGPYGRTLAMERRPGGSGRMAAAIELVFRSTSSKLDPIARRIAELRFARGGMVRPRRHFSNQDQKTRRSAVRTDRPIPLVSSNVKAITSEVGIG